MLSNSSIAKVVTAQAIVVLECSRDCRQLRAPAAYHSASLLTGGALDNVLAQWQNSGGDRIQIAAVTKESQAMGTRWKADANLKWQQMANRTQYYAGLILIEMINRHLGQNKARKRWPLAVH